MCHTSRNDWQRKSLARDADEAMLYVETRPHEQVSQGKHALESHFLAATHRCLIFFL